MDFSSLHHAGQLFVLPNAWDLGSARALLRAGFPAVGSTSLGVAGSHGLLDAAREIAEKTLELAQELRGLRCFVSMDIEDGFFDDPADVAAYVRELKVHGINLEDSSSGALVDPELHAAKISEVKRACPEVFVNARIDTAWLHQDIDVAETLRRARIYTEAGADGIFVPGALGTEAISELLRGICLPLNLLPSADHTAAELGALGVRRLSTGSLPYRAAMDAAVRAALAVRDSTPLPTATSYQQVMDSMAADPGLSG